MTKEKFKPKGVMWTLMCDDKKEKKCVDTLYKLHAVQVSHIFSTCESYPQYL